MFRIGIAEDDPSFQKTISEYIERYKKETNIDIQASFFQDGNDLVFKYEPIYDVLLLDIVMPKMKGMDAAREIRKRDQRVLIIFITNMAQYAINGYEVGALDFVLKPIKYFSFSYAPVRKYRPPSIYGTFFIYATSKALSYQSLIQQSFLLL